MVLPGLFQDLLSPKKNELLRWLFTDLFVPLPHKLSGLTGFDSGPRWYVSMQCVAWLALKYQSCKELIGENNYALAA